MKIINEISQSSQLLVLKNQMWTRPTIKAKTFSIKIINKMKTKRAQTTSLYVKAKKKNFKFLLESQSICRLCCKDCQHQNRKRCFNSELILTNLCMTTKENLCMMKTSPRMNQNIWKAFSMLTYLKMRSWTKIATKALWQTNQTNRARKSLTTQKIN